MKKLLLLVAIMLCCAMTIFAQNNKISYQAVVRNSENQLVANKSVDVTVEIFNGTETTAAYTETHTNVQTNFNGLISLQIGGGTATGVSWDEAEINWKNAKVITAVSLGGTQLATLEMPLTAVPYALYADYAEEINPDAVVVTEIYEKMLADSNALAGQITNLDSKLTNRINVISDSVKTNYENIALNRQAIIDSTAHIRTEIDTTSKAIRNTLTTTASAIRSEVDTKLQSYAQLGGNNTFSGNNTFGTVTASSVTVSCGNTTLDICTMYNELTNLIAGLNNTIDSLKGVITELLPSLSLKGKTDTMFTNGNTVNVTYTADFSNANSTDYTFHWTVDGTSVNSTSNPYTHPYTTIGTHKVVCTATRTGYATLTDSITTTISKGTPVVTAPTAKNLTYNTNAQTLVNAGSTTGGTLYYIVTNTNSKPDANASGWSTTLPQGTNAGTYYVWYKVLGGANYNNVDVSNTSVAVNIAKASGSISYSTTSMTKDAGASAFTNTLTKVGDGTVTYSISNSGSSCSINSSTGEVTVGNSAGTATITATVTDGTNYSYATTTATYTLTVQAADPIEVNSTFGYCYDCQRNPAYPKANQSASISGFGVPLVDDQGNTGFGHTTSADGPWKVEYVGVYSSTNQYGFTDSQINYLKQQYGMSSTASVPIFLLKKKINGQYVGLVYGVVCAYSKTTNNIDHTALFATPRENSTDGWGFYLTGQSHSSGISVTFDQDVSGGLNDLINQ